jgi:hypothetical protein
VELGGDPLGADAIEDEGAAGLAQRLGAGGESAVAVDRDRLVVEHEQVADREESFCLPALRGLLEEADERAGRGAGAGEDDVAAIDRAESEGRGEEGALGRGGAGEEGGEGEDLECGDAAHGSGPV